VAYNATGKEKYLTIGFGHMGPDVKPGKTITQAEADALLVKDLAKFETYVNDRDYVPITLTQNQFDALVSFAYNCGLNNLVKLCRPGGVTRNTKEIAAAIPLYNKGGGVVLQGLVRRRTAEVALFTKEDKPMANKSGFKDVPDSHWAAGAIKTVSDAGIMNGADGNFAPDKELTRAEAAAIVAKLLGKIG
jgi:GH24 family phage-related lysozyme (muramidase)